MFIQAKFGQLSSVCLIYVKPIQEVFWSADLAAADDNLTCFRSGLVLAQFIKDLIQIKTTGLERAQVPPKATQYGLFGPVLGSQGETNGASKQGHKSLGQFL